MPSIGSTTKTIRIYQNDLEIIEEMIAKGDTWSGAIHKLLSGSSETEVPFKDKARWKDFCQMVELSAATVDGVFNQLVDDMNLGTVEIIDGHLVGRNLSVDVDGFVSACHDANVETEKAMEKCIQMIRRGPV